jgi:hypothetical protein
MAALENSLSGAEHATNQDVEYAARQDVIRAVAGGAKKVSNLQDIRKAQQ